MARPGRKPKGDRHAIMVRVPKHHHAVYAERAAAAGMPLSDYLTVVLADVFDLETPGYIARTSNQKELPIVA